MSAAAKQVLAEGGEFERPDDDIFGGSSHNSMLTRLERGVAEDRPSGLRGDGDFPNASSTPSGSTARVPRWLERLLRIPLPVKLMGANVFLFAAATTTALVVRHRELSNGPVLTVVIVAFVAALLLNTGLVMLAVRPLRVLERTVDRIWHGDLAARVPTSLLADRHVTRVVRMFNILLDGLVADRARTRRLATELINASDRERAAMSRELHDSAAQSLAALVMQLSVALRGAEAAPRDVLQERLEAAKALATTTLEEIRLLAHTMHPRVLDDLGLIAALKRLARETSDHIATIATDADDNAVIVNVVAADGIDDSIPATVKSVLYRVAQEAVQNARRHAAPRHIEIRLGAGVESATLDVVDDGHGFDPSSQNERAGIGLFTMRERVALVDGEFHVASRPAGGTTVHAWVPFHGPSLTSRDRAPK